MGKSGLILRDQPGVINSFQVSKKWARENIRGASSLDNISIITGFGDSMKPMFNPGDPLIVDSGIKQVDADGAYFFRIGEEGFIKKLQRIPGVGIKAISVNKTYETWTITEDMDFEIFGRILKAWVSDDY